MAAALAWAACAGTTSNASRVTAPASANSVTVAARGRFRSSLRRRFATATRQRPTCHYLRHHTPVDTAKIDSTLALLEPHELKDALRLVSACERFGSMGQAEADEWRSRILGRQAFVDLPEHAASH